MRYSLSALFASAIALLAMPPVLSAQQRPHAGFPDSSAHVDSMQMGGTPGTTSMMADPLGIPMTRTGSGTTWLPDSAPMYARMMDVGDGWGLMLHGLAFVQYDRQGSRRGDSQFGSVNWGMAMASHALAGGRIDLRGMVSLEPWTVTARGYPLLLQSGESYRGRPLHDRQHPHDLFMEIAALYQRPVTSNLALQLYVAPVGEPATGPVAFPHRPSAASDPLAPLGHHWQDATHVSFGVLTGALYSRTVKIEGSIFNGREPDENRTNFDYNGRSLDSYAGRVTLNPSPVWSMSGSYAYLKSPEQLHPEESVHRATASVLNEHSFGRIGHASSALVYGGNWHAGARLSSTALAETNLDIDGRNTIYGRAEYVEKSAEDLAVGDAASAPIGPDAGIVGDEFRIGALALGYVRQIGTFSGGQIGLGIRGSVNMVPAALEPAYGTRTPKGFTVYFRFRPNRMEMGGHAHTPGSMPGMPGMPVTTRP